MRTDRIHRGDLVECCKLGLVFPATVTDLPGDQAVDVEPRNHSITYRRLRTREVRKVLERGTQLTIAEAGA